jgi:hypothetical protein
MILLRLISWPYVRKHVLRTALTTAGIVLGVAVFVGMHAANQAVMRGFAETVDRIAGKAQLQVSAGAKTSSTSCGRRRRSASRFRSSRWSSTRTSRAKATC